MEEILQIDDKKIFIYNILHDYSTNFKLMNDVLQIADNNHIPRTENGNGTFINLSKILDEHIINQLFLIVQTFNYSQNAPYEEKIYPKQVISESSFNKIDEKISLDPVDAFLLDAMQ
jgi:hypothetical protein|tara:strand:+ start:288 stop:638 length:351 start_codon:yes stop_codon:yes gene_type:complete